jgi:regulatory protein YycI of two-component signal transduction system YycFG
MKRNIIKYVFIVLIIVDAFLGGAYVEQKCAERQMNFVKEAIEDGDRVIFCDDGGIIRVRHDK